MPDDIYFSALHDHHLYDGLEEESCTGEELLIEGPAGQLQLLTSCPQCYQGESPIAVICHPHPLYGGSLNNKVVHILANTFNELGLLSVTFNFRGVGRSGGRFDNGLGETADLLAVVRWVRSRHPLAPLWLAGFSFGSFVALQAAQQLQIERLLLVAPPVSMFDFSNLKGPEGSWMVIQGGKDEVTAPEAVSAWVHRQWPRPRYEWLADADHFFHGRLNRLRERVLAAWGRGNSEQ